MTSGSPLTPHAALGWLGSLSIDIRALAILDASGVVLAGDAALATAGDAALATAGDPELAQAADTDGLIVARSGHHAIVARTGPKALARLVRADLQAAVEALEPR
jgi:hypothetical protein